MRDRLIAGVLGGLLVRDPFRVTALRAGRVPELTGRIPWSGATTRRKDT
jgi:hypothetical protein